MTEQDTDWIGLMIGNSRLHWGYFRGQTLLACLDTPHLNEPLSNEFLRQIFPKLLTNKYKCAFIVASVVPSQKELCANYGNLRIITLKDIPLLDLYPTFGIDRALAVLGAGKKYGFPCLVIDAGTALTFTGVDRDKKLVGGAILPGLKVQLASTYVLCRKYPNNSRLYSKRPKSERSDFGILANRSVAKRFGCRTTSEIRTIRLSDVRFIYVTSFGFRHFRHFGFCL